MTKLINAKCPNCGAVLELPERLDRAFCMHCGGRVIIAKDVVHYHVEGKAAIACPECHGRGHIECTDDYWKDHIETMPVEPVESISDTTRLILLPCGGSGECNNHQQDEVFFNWRDTFDGKSVCDNGKCFTCGARGEDGAIFKLKCRTCGGTGECRFCKGSGECIYCGGAGKVECGACNGTGFKLYPGK